METRYFTDEADAKACAAAIGSSVARVGVVFAVTVPTIEGTSFEVIEPVIRETTDYPGDENTFKDEDW